MATNTTTTDRSAGRYCATCKGYGSHHTDRHDEFHPPSPPVSIEDARDVLDVIRAHRLIPGIRDMQIHCVCGWVTEIPLPGATSEQKHNEHLAEKIYEAGFVHKNQIADLITTALTAKGKARIKDQEFYDALMAALHLTEEVK